MTMKQDPYVVCDLHVVPGLQVFQGAVVPREVCSNAPGAAGALAAAGAAGDAAAAGAA